MRAKIDGHFARRKSRRRILWLDCTSCEEWLRARQAIMDRIVPCHAAEVQTGFGKKTLLEFERVDLVRSVNAPPFSQIRGLCFDRFSIMLLIERVAMSADQETRANNQASISLGEATRLYLRRTGLAQFLLSLNKEQCGQANSCPAADVRLCDLKFPLYMILQFNQLFSQGSIRN